VYYLAYGLPERQPHKAVKTTAARNKHCEKLTSRRIRTLDRKSKAKNWLEQWSENPKIAGSNPARGQFFAILISCSRCSDGSLWLPFW